MQLQIKLGGSPTFLRNRLKLHGPLRQVLDADRALPAVGERRRRVLYDSELDLVVDSDLAVRLEHLVEVEEEAGVTVHAAQEAEALLDGGDDALLPPLARNHKRLV